MTAAYIMIKSSPGAEGDVSAKIKKISGVKTAHTITGPYDLIAYVEAEDLDLLGKTVISKIQNMKGVTDTMTCVVVDPYKNFRPQKENFNYFICFNIILVIC